MSADTRTNDELLDAARNGDEGALAVLAERHRDRLERMVRLRIRFTRRYVALLDPLRGERRVTILKFEEAQRRVGRWVVVCNPG